LFTYYVLFTSLVHVQLARNAENKVEIAAAGYELDS